MSATTRCGPEVEIGERFRAVRRRTLALCEPLTPEDMMVQSISEASPAKWHLAHTAWFFETFILREFVPGYRLFNPDFPWLFNSYYQNMGHFPEKRLRSSFGRPGLDEVLGYRQHVDEAIEHLLERTPDAEPLQRIELGLNHEEQHQELLLTDILHAFFTNPLRPVYLREAEAVGESGLRSSSSQKRTPVRSALAFQPFEGGLHEVGYGGQGFCYDNEQPRHRVWLEPYSLARRLVTCGEYAEFMADGGYRHPEFWLSTGRPPDAFYPRQEMIPSIVGAIPGQSRKNRRSRKNALPVACTKEKRTGVNPSFSRYSFHVTFNKNSRSGTQPRPWARRCCTTCWWSAVCR